MLISLSYCHSKALIGGALCRLVISVVALFIFLCSTVLCFVTTKTDREMQIFLPLVLDECQSLVNFVSQLLTYYDVQSRTG